MRKWRRSDLSVQEIHAPSIPIVSDALVATRGVGEGRVIPLIIVDSSAHRYIEDLVRAHDKSPPGDVETQWGWVKGTTDVISLLLFFKRPVESSISLNFDIARHGGLVDVIMNSQAFYLQPGRRGDRVRDVWGNPSILVEVPNTGFWPIWIERWQRVLVKDLRKRGLRRSEAKAVSRAYIESLREASKFRMRRVQSDGEDPGYDVWVGERPTP